jgi:hypothetical protein
MHLKQVKKKTKCFPWAEWGLGLILLSFPIFGISPEDLEKDPYVELYRIRFEEAKVDVLAAEQDVQYQSWYLKILTGMTPGVVSQQEIIQKQRDADVASLSLQKAEKTLKEKQALVNVVRSMRAAGKEVPLFVGGN